MFVCFVLAFSIRHLEKTKYPNDCFKGKESTGEEGRGEEERILKGNQKGKKRNELTENNQCSSFFKLSKQVKLLTYVGNFQQNYKWYIKKYYCTMLDAPLQRMYFGGGEHLFLSGFSFSC